MALPTWGYKTRVEYIRAANFYQKHSATASAYARYLVALRAKFQREGRQDGEGLAYWSAREAQADARRMADLAQHFLTLALGGE